MISNAPHVFSSAPSPTSPFCFSAGLRSAKRARKASGKCSQNAVVCISCSGIDRLPAPMFSIV